MVHTKDCPSWIVFFLILSFLKNKKKLSKNDKNILTNRKRRGIIILRKCKGDNKMEHYKKSLIVTLIIDRIAMAAWLICIPLVPFIARWYDVYSNKESIFPQFVSCVYTAMIPAGVILFFLNRLLTNIRKEKVFETENVFCLRVFSYCCFAIAAVSAVMAIWRLLALIVVLAFAFIGLLLRVLKNVFEQAVVLREENDLTV